GNCIGCTSDADCSNPKPACNTSGDLIGQCTECTTANSTLCSGTKPQCISSLGVCGCTDTDGDSECGGPNSGIICNGPVGERVPACTTHPPRNACPTTEHCSDQSGAVGTCQTMCTSTADCTVAPDLVCKMTPTPHVCVECVQDTDCPAGKLCDETANKCVEC